METMHAIHLGPSATNIKTVPATVRLKTPRLFITRTNGRVLKMVGLEIFKVRESELLCSFLFILDGMWKNVVLLIFFILSCSGTLNGRI